MVSRLYFPNGGAAAIAPAYDPSWDVTSQAVRIRLAHVPTNQPGGGVGIEKISSAVNVNALGDQYISDPLPGDVTIDGTVTVATPAREMQISGDGGTARFRVVVRLVTSTGATRGILLDGITTNLPSYPFYEYHAVSGTIDPIAAQAGDRIVIERGYRYSGSTTTSLLQGNFHRGDDFSATDVAWDTFTAGNNLRPWAEFSRDDIWGPPKPSLAGMVAAVAESPVRTDTRLGGMGVATLDKPSHPGTRLGGMGLSILDKPAHPGTRVASMMVQILVPRAGQRIRSIYAEGFENSQPMMKLPNGQWRALQPHAPDKKATPTLIEASGSYSGSSATITMNPRPGDVLVMMTSTKTPDGPSFRTVDGNPSGIPGVAWQRVSTGDRHVVWIGTDATAPGTATYSLSGSDNNRTTSLFLLRGVAPVLAQRVTKFTPLSTPQVFDAPMVKKNQVVLVDVAAGNGTSVTYSDAIWKQGSLGPYTRAVRIHPLVDTPSVTITIGESSGLSGQLVVIG